MHSAHPNTWVSSSPSWDAPISCSSATALGPRGDASSTCPACGCDAAAPFNTAAPTANSSVPALCGRSM